MAPNVYAKTVANLPGENSSLGLHGQNYYFRQAILVLFLYKIITNLVLFLLQNLERLFSTKCGSVIFLPPTLSLDKPSNATRGCLAGLHYGAA